MSRWVFDCSAAMALLMSDEEGVEVEKIVAGVISADDRIMVPPLFWYEVSNVLVTAHRRGRIDLKVLREHETDLAALPFETEQGALDPFIRQRVREYTLAHELSAYDASYLEMADRRDAMLKTFDKHLLALSGQFPFIQ